MISFATFLLACLAISAQALPAASPTQENVVAKRQVDTQFLRTRGPRQQRWTSRVATGSPVASPYETLSQYVNCPDAPAPLSLYFEKVVMTADHLDTDSILCKYMSPDSATSGNGQTACSYDTSTGKLQWQTNASFCPQQLKPAYEDSTGACYTGCPSQMASEYLISGDIRSYGGAIDTTCIYSPQKDSTSGDFSCKYSTLTGQKTQGSNRCRSSISAVSTCINNMTK